MVGPHIKLSECVVYRQRQANYRTSSYPCLRWRQYGVIKWPEVSNGRIVDNCTDIIEDERPRETVVICQKPSSDQDSWNKPRPRIVCVCGICYNACFMLHLFKPEVVPSRNLCAISRGIFWSPGAARKNVLYAIKAPSVSPSCCKSSAMLNHAE